MFFFHLSKIYFSLQDGIMTVYINTKAKYIFTPLHILWCAPKTQIKFFFRHFFYRFCQILLTNTQKKPDINLKAADEECKKPDDLKPWQCLLKYGRHNGLNVSILLSGLNIIKHLHKSIAQLCNYTLTGANSKFWSKDSPIATFGKICSKMLE